MLLTYPRLKARRLFCELSRSFAIAPYKLSYWIKSIAIELLLFGYFFLAVEEKVTGLKGFESKTGKDASKR
jgi:hypothetical protein